MHCFLYKSLNYVNFDNSVTKKKWPTEERKYGLAEGEEIFRKSRGGSEIYTHSSHIF
jgi:hypothetical protein